MVGQPALHASLDFQPPSSPSPALLPSSACTRAPTTAPPRPAPPRPPRRPAAFSFIGPGELGCCHSWTVSLLLEKKGVQELSGELAGGHAVLAGPRCPCTRRGRAALSPKPHIHMCIADFAPKLIDEADLSFFAQLRDYKARYPRLKTLISVGGW